MSTSVDNRVVSMEFDNAKFERNVETSLNTLKHLDQSLDSLTHGSKAFDGVSFENLANQIDNIASRFTLMGRITMRVFDEIADGIVNLGKKLMAFNTDQISSGWQKYADKTESVQTIMSATGREIEYVEEQLDRLNRFSDETSYSFVDMTSNIAKFTSQGIDLDSAVTSMQGIATWAASAGQNAQAASRAMYNISQAMGVGAMHLIDWKSIQNANMATKQFKEQAIAAALELGTLEKKNDAIFTKATGSAKAMEVNVQNFAETLKNDWFSSDVMTKVFTEYGKFADLVDETYERFDENILVSQLIKLADAQKTASDRFESDLLQTADEAGVSVEELRAAITALNAKEYEFSMQTYKAAQEAKTFKDAVDAAADAISTSWMKVFQTIFGNYEQAKVIWTDLANWFYDLFAEPVNNLNGILEDVFNFGDDVDLSEVQKYIKETAVDLLDMGDAAEKAFKDLGLLSDADIKKYGSAREAIKNIKLTADDVGNVIDRLLGEDGGAAQTKKGVEALEDYKKVVQDIWHGKYGSGQDRIDALNAAGYDADAAQNLLNKWHYGIQVTNDDIARLTVTGAKSKEITEEQAKQLEILKKRLDDGTASVDEYIKKNQGMTGRELLFGKEEGRIGALYNIIDAINNIRKASSDAWGAVFGGDKVSRIRAFLQILQASTEKLSKLTKDNDTLKNSFKAVFTVLRIGLQSVSAFISAIRQIIDLFKPTREQTVGFIDSLNNLIFKFDEWLQKNKVFEKAVNIIVGAFRLLKAVLDPVVAEFRKFINDLKESESVQKAFATLQYAIQALTQKLKGLTSENRTFTTAIKAVVTVVKIILGVIFAVISAIAQVIGLFAPGEEAASGFINKISELIFKLDEWLKKNKVFEKTTNAIVAVFKTLKSVFSDVIGLFAELIKTGDFKSFISSLIERFSGMFNWATKLKDVFKEWFSNLGGNSQLLSRVGDGFEKIAKSAKELYSAKIGPIFATIKDSLSKISLQNIVQGFVAAKNGVVDFFKILWDFIKTGNWQKFLSDISSRFSTLVEWIEKVRDVFGNWFEGFDKNTLSALISLTSGLLGFIAILKVLKSFGSVKYALIEFLSDLSSTVRSFKRSKAIADMTTIAITIGILVASLFLITKIPEGDLKRSITALGVILGAIVVLIGLIGLIANTPGAAVASGIAMSMAAFLVSIAILAGALWALTKLDYSNIWSALGVLAGIMAAVAALAFATSKMKGSFAGGGLGLITYALGVLLLVKALKTIQNESSLLNADSFKKLFGLITIVVGMGIAMRHVRFGSALGIIALAASLVFIQRKLREAMKDSIKFSEFQQYSKELIAIFGILAGLGLILRLSGKGSLGSVVSLLALIGLIFVVTEAVKKLGIIDDDKLLKGVGAITAIGIVFAALIFALGQAGKVNKEGMKSLRAVSLTLIGLMIALVVLSAIPWPALKQGLIAMLSVLGAFSVVLVAAGSLMKWSRSLNGWKVATLAILVGGIVGLMIILNSISSDIANADNLITAAESMALIMLALAAAMRIVAGVKVDSANSLKATTIFADMIAMLIPALGALYIIQKMNIQASIPTVTALGILLVAMSAALRILNGIKGDAGKAVGSGLALALAAGAMIGLAYAMQMLNEVNPEGLIPKVQALAILFGAIAAATFVLSYTKSIDFGQFILIGVGIVLMIEVLKEIAKMMPLLDNINVDGLLTKTTALSELLLALSAAMTIMSFIPIAGIGSAVVGIIAVLGIIAVMAYGFYEAGKIMSETEGAAEFMITGATAIGTAIGKFIGAIGGGIVSGAVEAATDLDNFVKNLTPLIDQLKRFDDTALAGVSALSGLLLSLAASNMASSISSIVEWITGVPTNMGSSLTNFATAVKSYIDALAGLDPKQVQTVSRITQAISSLLSAMPKEGGLFSLFTGTKANSFSQLSGNLERFGQTIIKFVDSVSDIPADAATKTQNAVDAATKIVDFSKTLQRTGGVISWLSGEQNLGKFGIQLGSFVTALFGSSGEAGAGANLGFFEALNNANIDAGMVTKIDDLKTLLDPMVEIAQKIPTMGGLIETAFGSNDPATFASKMVEFIGHIKEVLDEVANLDSSGTAIEDLQKAKEIALALSEFNAAMNGENVDLSQQVDADGNAISQTTDIISDAMAKFMSLETDGAQDKMASLKDIFSGTSLFGEAGEGGIANLDALTEQFATVQEAITTGMTGIATTVDENAATTSESMTVFLEELGVSLDTFGEKAFESGELMGTKYGEGIDSKKSDVDAKASALGSSAKTKLGGTATSGSAYTIGANYGYGFARGIASQVGNVQNAVQQLADAANRTLTVTLSIQSPSKVARQYGSYYGEGFAIGIDSTASAVEKASQNIANASTSGLATALSAINDIVESDAQPVITPVLDLSEVRRGVNSISDINGITANVGYANASAVMSETSQNVSGNTSQIQNGSTPTIQFNQYNNSPKALSRIEIYRQTKNLISMQREAASV